MRGCSHTIREKPTLRHVQLPFSNLNSMMTTCSRSKSPFCVEVINEKSAVYIFRHEVFFARAVRVITETHRPMHTTAYQITRGSPYGPCHEFAHL